MSAKLDVKNILEADVVEQVKNIIKLTGVRLQRINTGAFKVGKRYIRTAEVGTLDFEGYDKHGRFLGVECKRPLGGRVSPAQAARIADIKQAGGVAFVVHSGEELLQGLRDNDCI